MKKAYILFPALLILVISCESKTNVLTPAPVSKPAVIGTPIELNTGDANLQDWMNYYRGKGKTLDVKQFVLKDTNWTEQLEGNVTANFETDFKPVYEPFFVYSPDKTKYIDFDSYQWMVGKDKQPAFNPDQEVDLVDLKTKKVQRIAFRGPSQWVENVSWKNDSVVCLLEATDEKMLFISEVELKTGKIKTYKYKGKIPFKSDYSKKRLAARLK